MNSTFIIFISSGTAMVVLLCAKALQEKFGILLFWPNQRRIVERYLNRKVKEIDNFLAHTDERALSIFFHRILVKVREFFSRIQEWIDRKSFWLVRLISGKQDIGPQGKASHFLHDIRSFKDTFKKE